MRCISVLHYIRLFIKVFPFPGRYAFHAEYKESRLPYNRAEGVLLSQPSALRSSAHP